MSCSAVGLCTAVAPRCRKALYKANKYDLNALSDDAPLCNRVLYSVTLSPAAPELSTAFCVFQRSTESNSDTASGSKAWHLDAWRQATRRQLYRMVRTQNQKVPARQLAARLVSCLQNRLACEQALRGPKPPFL